MNLPLFVDNRYQELQQQSKGEETYNLLLDAQMKGLHTILNTYRGVLKWAVIPKLLFEWWEVRQGLRPSPEPVLVIQMKKAQKEAELKKQSHLKAVESGETPTA